MKKIFTGILAAAFVAGTVSAFAKQVIIAPKADEETYTWNRTGGEGSPEEQNPYVGTKTQAENYFGCSGTVDECAVGEPASLGLPPAVIYQH